jgi:phospholipid/cholesterol/gamma-HCH transport system permease protein
MEQRESQLGFATEADGALRVRLRGVWKLGEDLPAPEEVSREAPANLRRALFDGSDLGEWDTGLLAFLRRTTSDLRAQGVEVDLSDLPDGVHRLLDLATAVPTRDTGDREDPRGGLLGRIGKRAIGAWTETIGILTFIGEATLSFVRLPLRRARFQWSDVWLAIEEAGAHALGIVGLISFLIGAILAFMGAVQLRLFGAEIYVANLVAIGMSREMSAMMTGVIVAGRTGAAYAAQLGTMTVNEEVDALRVLGVDPVDFLVLPRMLALVLMMPLLAIYANLLGILGGMLVADVALGIDPSQYWTQTLESVGLQDFAVGLIKAVVVGVLVAIAGCMRGLQSGRSASAVGRAATSAVVTAIVMIVVSEAIFAVIFEALGI